MFAPNKEYGFTKILAMSFENAKDKVTEALKKRNLGSCQRSISDPGSKRSWELTSNNRLSE
jgi:hypothetical protein